ncbi:hypothetical protein PUW24_23960 [Paenibacillus urinalis]|uniref:Uncharacterized protein n=1 Tax=Paenibacillus urinalis TaxID=521520 RepID=A0AAX3MUH6_9BACL|nr:MULTISPECIES: hypothetical protein [Paenibacillus]WDH81101.1 hypothetical protein PUW23_16360 [Paenibacillus urinalis]WDH97154.1 hypothetical protein PUW24_23960 [Paenibacillus urinalis]WDI00816.1 hypothetical protein PUW25_16185 [Paenibacillus urinalis]GAK39499.1 hypothetical protein TCA2_1987 [Paenibacillus sp. TCA20]
MKSYVFAGPCDKTDLLLNMSKILSVSGYRVILVDGTVDGRYRYCIEEGHSTPAVTEYEGFDVAIGYRQFNEVEQALLELNEDVLYDYVIFDIELTGFLNTDQWLSAAARVWTTDYSRMTLECGKAWIKELCSQMVVDRLPPFYKLYIEAVDTHIESYIWAYYEDSPIEFQGSPVWFRSDELDTAVRLENEHHRRRSFRHYSRDYKKSLAELMEMVAGIEPAETRRALQSRERKRA